MTLPHAFRGAMRVPAIAAPMFLVSGPELVTETCKAGVAGTFPALNARTSAQLDAWLGTIDKALATARAADPSAPIAPYGINLILHASNPRGAGPGTHLPPPGALRHHQPGPSGRRGEGRPCLWGAGLLDVIHAYHARKAIAAGVDGIIAVAGGAGGHAGTQSAFSLVREIREFWTAP
jgi:nitronate monooxygenase